MNMKTLTNKEALEFVFKLKDEGIKTYLLKEDGNGIIPDDLELLKPKLYISNGYYSKTFGRHWVECTGGILLSFDSIIKYIKVKDIYGRFYPLFTISDDSIINNLYHTNYDAYVIDIYDIELVTPGVFVISEIDIPTDTVLDINKVFEEGDPDKYSYQVHVFDGVQVREITINTDGINDKLYVFYSIVNK